MWEDSFIYCLEKGEKENEKQKEVFKIIKNTSG